MSLPGALQNHQRFKILKDFFMSKASLLALGAKNLLAEWVRCFPVSLYQTTHKRKFVAQVRGDCGCFFMDLEGVFLTAIID